MKKTMLTSLFSICFLLAFGQDTTQKPLDPVKDLLLNDFKTAELLKNVKTKHEALDAISKNKSQLFLKMTDSIQIETSGGKVKSITIYSHNEDFDSANQFFTIKSPSKGNELAIDLNAKMDIKGKAKQSNDKKTVEWVIQDIIASDTKTGYKLILKRTK